MKQVTVYTTKKNVVASHGEYVPQYKLAPIDISYQAGECFDKRSVEEVHLPIQRFRWCDGREVFAAFDEELLEMIGCLQSQRDDEIMRAKIKIAEAFIKSYQAELSNKVKSLSFWQRIKFVFTNKLEE